MVVSNTLEEVFFPKLEPTKQVYSEPLATPLHACFNWQQALDDLAINPIPEPLSAYVDNDRNGIDRQLHDQKPHEQSPCYQDSSTTVKTITVGTTISPASVAAVAQSQDGINVDDAERIRKRRFYVVVFRSVRREGADTQALYSADAEAYIEATSSGGLIRYWYGILNLRRECFATCIWNSREDAERASGLPKHRIAVSLASKMYESYQLEKYWLTFDTTRGDLSFEKIFG